MAVGASRVAVTSRGETLKGVVAEPGGSVISSHSIVCHVQDDKYGSDCFFHGYNVIGLDECPKLGISYVNCKGAVKKRHFAQKNGGAGVWMSQPAPRYGDMGNMQGG